MKDVFSRSLAFLKKFNYLNNNKMLNEDEKIESCDAVRRFLIDGEKFIKGGNILCNFIEGRQVTETTINISLIDHIPSYNLDYDVFKSYGLKNPLWSAYKLLKWDEQSKELVIEVDKHRNIRLKRINR